MAVRYTHICRWNMYCSDGSLNLMQRKTAEKGGLVLAENFPWMFTPIHFKLCSGNKKLLWRLVLRLSSCNLIIPHRASRVRKTCNGECTLRCMYALINFVVAFQTLILVKKHLPAELGNVLIAPVIYVAYFNYSESVTCVWSFHKPRGNTLINLDTVENWLIRLIDFRWNNEWHTY